MERGSRPHGSGGDGEPVWDLALLFPQQGAWSEDDYLALNRRTNWPIELSDGRLEVLAMPTPFHQRIVKYLFKLLEAFVLANAAGEVFVAPLPVRLWPGKLREPDVLYLRPGRIRDAFSPPDGADLAMEVVSEGEESRDRDLRIKRAEYARAGFAEYWIVDPRDRTITVLVLDAETYREHGIFGLGSNATSVLFPGFQVDVREAFAAGEAP